MLIMSLQEDSMSATMYKNSKEGHIIIIFINFLNVRSI